MKPLLLLVALLLSGCVSQDPRNWYSAEEIELDHHVQTRQSLFRAMQPSGTVRY